MFRDETLKKYNVRMKNKNNPMRIKTAFFKQSVEKFLDLLEEGIREKGYRLKRSGWLKPCQCHDDEYYNCRVYAPIYKIDIFWFKDMVYRYNMENWAIFIQVPTTIDQIPMANLPEDKHFFLFCVENCKIN